VIVRLSHLVLHLLEDGVEELVGPVQRRLLHHFRFGLLHDLGPILLMSFDLNLREKLMWD
jgi:hypothetical protein